MRPNWLLTPALPLLAVLVACGQPAEEPVAPARAEADDVVARIQRLRQRPTPELWAEMQQVHAEIRSLAERVEYAEIPALANRLVELASAMYHNVKDDLEQPHRVLAKRAIVAVNGIPRRVAFPAASNWPGEDMDGAMLYVDSCMRMVEEAYPREVLYGPALSPPDGEANGDAEATATVGGP